jgi:mRNA interferase MazF
MKQGEIWLADLNPTKGSEQNGVRPVIIISGNLLNDHANVLMICPLTTSIKRYHGNLILEPDAINGLSATSEALTLHIRSVSKDRLKNRMGKINPTELSKIKNCLNDLLRY